MLEIDGNPNMNSANGGAATINIQTTFDIQAGSTFSAKGLGFAFNAGPGEPGGQFGASHGGAGFNSNKTYGSVLPDQARCLQKKEQN